MSSVARAFATERFRRSPAQRQLTVLHIDDDPNDTTLLQAATRRAGLNLALKNLEDFEHAIAYLGGHGSYSDRFVYPLPKLILLDLKMPRATGFEVLRWIRGTPGVSNIPSSCFPVFVLLLVSSLIQQRWGNTTLDCIDTLCPFFPVVDTAWRR
jgi:CheY-like chemotaxis protein